MKRRTIPQSTGKTRLLTWNPKEFEAQWKEDAKEFALKGIAYSNWSTDAHKATKIGDRFFIIKLGVHPKGIFGSGMITSLPKIGRSWNERRKKSYYVDVTYDRFFDPDTETGPPLTLATLEKICSRHKFWTPENCGKEIPEETAAKLELAWAECDPFVTERVILAFENEKQCHEYYNAVSDLTETEKEIVQKARIGQGKYREELIEIWRGRCSVTGFGFEKALIASHIKAWKNSDNREKLDKHNGLLLTPNLDKLFDQRLIAFDENGGIMIAPALGQHNISLLGIQRDMKLHLSELSKTQSEKIQQYLTIHREEFLQKHKLNF